MCEYIDSRMNIVNFLINKLEEKFSGNHDSEFTDIKVQDYLFLPVKKETPPGSPNDNRV